jgi:hypothetical protein
MGHTGTLVNGTAWAPGKFGTAVSFDGVNDIVSVANPSTLNMGTADFTVSMWVKRNALGGGVQRHLFSKCAPAAWEFGCKELYFVGDLLRFGTYGTGDTDSATIADTNWHHVALTFTRSTSTVRIYVDATLRTSAAQNIEADNSAHVVQVGNLRGSNTFSGLLDEVRFYARALTAAEVATDTTTPVDAGTTPPPPPPPPPVPTVSLTATPSSIAYGATSTLSWSSTNATSCAASGAWSGAKATSGVQTQTLTANSTFTLTCTGAGGSAMASTTVSVGAPPAGTTLSWNPVVYPTLAGYRVFYGQASGTYGTSIDVGNVTVYNVPGLVSGVTYYFVVRAVDGDGAESPPSNEVSKTIP